MPLYGFKCSVCGKDFDVFNKLDDFTRFYPCSCSGMSVLQIGKPAVETWNPYFDKLQQKEFRTKRDFDNYCRENGLSRATKHECKVHREEVKHLAYKEIEKQRKLGGKE